MVLVSWPARTPCGTNRMRGDDLVAGALALLLVGADPVAAPGLDRQQPHHVGHRAPVHGAAAVLADLELVGSLESCR